MTLLIPFLTFVLIALTILGIWVSGVRMSRTWLPDDESRRPLIFGPLTKPLAYMFWTGSASYDSMRRDQRRSGFYGPFALEEFLAFRNALTAGWILFVFTVIVGAQPEGALAIQLFFAGTAGLALLYSIPRLWLQNKGNHRVRLIQTQLPDALDMISMCMSGGMPLQPALQCVSGELKHTHPELAREFHIIHQQADSHTLTLAIEQFAQRIDVDETNTLAALVAQTERLGTNIGHALREYADAVRRSFRQRAEEAGNKASIKMLLPVSFCLAPPVYILLLAPALLELRDFVSRENRPGGVLSQAGDSLDSYSELSDFSVRETQGSP